ncbi:MAG TPA: glycine cleavage system aminomethyltransferase GcvT [Deltaproteobacteria bacterium]|nr:glycine cleavage system aminomethyltransferase GcvT [Deltaproteobacteria bacterium]
MRRTPFFEHHERAGGRMVPFAGFSMPVSYSGLKEEHLRTRASVGLFDVSHMGEIRVRGPAAEDALMWLLSNAIRRIEPGSAQYNAMCNPAGGVVDDVFVYRLAADDFLVCVNAANRDKDLAWILANNPHGAEVIDEGDRWAQLAIQGPRGVDVVDQLVDFDAGEVARHRFRVASFAGIEGAIVARTGYTGEDGFEVFLPAERAAPAWSAILEAGEPHGILPVGLGARDTLRLEVRNCLYGHELNDDTSPLQAGLGWIVKLKKPGGFIGSEAIAARRGSDPQVLVGMVLQGKRIARGGMVVSHAAQPVGRVTSGTLGPSVGRPVALAYVDRACSEVGTELQIDVRGREARGVVVDGSFLEAR